MNIYTDEDIMDAMANAAAAMSQGATIDRFRVDTTGSEVTSAKAELAGVSYEVYEVRLPGGGMWTQRGACMKNSSFWCVVNGEPPDTSPEAAALERLWVSAFAAALRAERPA